jgi:hypothetical protein
MVPLGGLMIRDRPCQARRWARITGMRMSSVIITTILTGDLLHCIDSGNPCNLCIAIVSISSGWMCFPIIWEEVREGDGIDDEKTEEKICSSGSEIFQEIPKRRFLYGSFSP